MLSPKQAVSCRYHYDPLDRLTGTDQTGEANAQRFYQKTHLVTEIQGELQRTIFQHDDQLLAQHQREKTAAAATLLATDQQRSVLHTLNGPDHKQQSYSAYGHRPAESGLNALLGFNGERRDPVTGCYMLGNGYRAFNPVLMRFNSPDSLSPFGEGGLNGYAYCQGDPVNFEDPTGNSPFKRYVDKLSLKITTSMGKLASKSQPTFKAAKPVSSPTASIVGASSSAATASASQKIASTVTTSAGRGQAILPLGKETFARHIMESGGAGIQKELSEVVAQYGLRGKLLSPFPIMDKGALISIHFDLRSEQLDKIINHVRKTPSEKRFLPSYENVRETTDLAHVKYLQFYEDSLNWKKMLR